MSLQNRVLPTGEIVADTARGTLTGNRGVLAFEGDRLGRARWTHPHWILCTLEHPRGLYHGPRPKNRWTPLFFLDEATAYAVGHRPCAECRRADWLRFAGRWAAVFGPTGAEGIDRALHAARLDGRGRRLVPVTPGSVPEGAMVAEGAAVLLRAPEGWRRWSFAGYTPAEAPAGPTRLLTPEPLARLMAAGLPVQIRDG